MENRNICRVCTKEITIAIRKGTGICSENCKKVDEKEK